jgi:hypothetical protein
MPTNISAAIAQQILKTNRENIPYPIATETLAQEVAVALRGLLPQETSATVVPCKELGFKAAIVLDSVENPNHMVFARPPKT